MSSVGWYEARREGRVRRDGMGFGPRLLGGPKMPDIKGNFWRPWLPFLNTYRNMCMAPTVEFRRALNEIGEMHQGT